MISYWKFLKIFAIGYFGISVISVSAQTNTNTQTVSQHEEPVRYSFYYNGTEREYFVWLPKDFDADRIYWGLVTVHGGGSDGRTFWLTEQMRRAADEIGLHAIVISPSFLKDDPNAQRFPILGEGAFLEHILEDIHSMYQLKSKILLTGYSRGAQFTHRFALWNPTLVQACAPLSAGSWTTPDGRFLMFSLAEVENPESYLASPQNSEGLASSQKSLFDSRVAKVAGRPASSGAKSVPFLVMCGTIDERFDIAQKFASSLQRLGYITNTAWPKTPHGGRKKDEYRTEFEKYSQVTVGFFLRVTEDK
jgi:poly(3-hydroxybutyrate) depolymerase